MNDYSDFLATKQMRAEAAGAIIHDSDIHPVLFDFQRDLVKWALRLSRAAIFADCGMGKTPMQVEWARQVGGVPCALMRSQATSAQSADPVDAFLALPTDHQLRA